MLVSIHTLDKSILMMFLLHQTLEQHSLYSSWKTYKSQQSDLILQILFSLLVIQKVYYHQLLGCLINKPIINFYQDILQKLVARIFLLNYHNQLSQLVSVKSSFHFIQQYMQKCFMIKLKNIMLKFGLLILGKFYINIRWTQGKYGDGQRISLQDS